MPRRVLHGTVVSDKNDKTIVVRVDRQVMHPLYKKYIRRSKRYAAHDESNGHKVGDNVRIIECRPLSRTKRWMVMGEGEVAPKSAHTLAIQAAEMPTEAGAES